MSAVIEDILELWAFILRDIKGRMRPLFRQDRIADSAGHFLDGFLGEERRKTGWMRAESAGNKGPWRQHDFLDRIVCQADDLRGITRDYALKTLAYKDAVLVMDETGFLKKGVKSCGVNRQYMRTVGKVDNCQIRVFYCYVS